MTEREVNASNELLVLSAQGKGALSWLSCSAVTQAEAQLSSLSAKAVSPWPALGWLSPGCACTGLSQQCHHHGRMNPTSPRPHTGTSQRVGLCLAEETQPPRGARLEPAATAFGREENPMVCGHTACKAPTSSLISQPCSSRENYK